MRYIETVYDAEDIIRAKLERHGITGVMQTLLYHVIHKVFFILVILFLFTLISLTGGVQLNHSIPAYVIALVIQGVIIVYLYTQVFKAPAVEPLEQTDIITYQRDVAPDELALGYAWGEENGQEVYQLKGIPQEDRNIHHYIIGGSGSGKSRFIQSIINQDIANKAGFGLIDPHGDLFEDTMGYLALTHYEEFLHDNVVVVDPTHETFTATFNPIQPMQGISSAEIANELVFVFHKVWGDSWGYRMADIIRMSLMALSENGMTLNDVPPLLTNAEFRAKVLANVTNETCLRYFHDRYNVQPKKIQAEWAEPVLNKMSALLSDRRIRHVFAAKEGSFNLRDVMDSGKILLVNLNRGKLKGASDTLGAILTSAFQMAAYSRSDIPPSQRKQYYLYIDEFENMASESFTEMLGEARKYRISLILAHQNITQVSKELASGVMSNCSLQTYFRLMRNDAGLLSKEGLLALYEENPSWEDLTQMLQKLQTREFIMHNKNGGGVVMLTSLPTPSPHKLVDLSEEEFRERLSAIPIGRKYMRTREDIQEEIRKRDTPEEENEDNIKEEEQGSDPIDFWEPEKS